MKKRKAKRIHKLYGIGIRKRGILKRAKQALREMKIYSLQFSTPQIRRSHKILYRLYKKGLL